MYITDLWCTLRIFGVTFFHRTVILCSVCKGLFEVVAGEGRKSVIHRTSAMATSAEPEVPTNNVTVKKLEEEVWEGCVLQHGEMSAEGVKIHFVEAGDPAGKLVRPALFSHLFVAP